MKMKNRTFAIPAAALAIPPKPNTAAIKATIKNVSAHPSMPNSFYYRFYRTFGVFVRKGNGDGVARFKCAGAIASRMSLVRTRGHGLECGRQLLPRLI